MTNPVDTDALRRLGTWLYDESRAGKAELVNAAADEVDRLRADNDEYDSILTLQGNLLTGVANAVQGPPPPLTSWSHADLPERVARLRALIENAPHSNWCATEDSRRVYEFPPCTCWKADAL